MKTIRILLILAFVFVAFGSTTPASAFSFSSGIRVFNLSSTSDAHITLNFYDLGGGFNTSAPDTLSPNTSKSFFPLAAVSSGFNGSVVVSSDVAIASTSNLHAYNGATMSAAGSYTARDSGAPTVFLPNLMKGNGVYNTWFNVQNAGSGPATVLVEYNDSTTATKTINTPGAAVTFNQATETHPGKTFGAKVSNTGTNQPLVVSYVQESTQQIFASNGYYASDYSKTPYLPLINENNRGWTTGSQIQNAGTLPTNVTVTYTPRLTGGAGTQCTETHTINPGQNVTFARIAFSPGGDPGSTCTPGQKFIGNGRVTANTANQDLVASVNLFINPVIGGAYNGVNPATGTSKVILPLIQDRNGAWFTGFNIQNVGSSATTVNCTFTGGVSYTFSATIQPGDTAGELQDGKIQSGYTGSGTCIATGGDAKIIGLVTTNNKDKSKDLFMVYNALNLTP